MDELASQMEFVLSHFGLKQVIGFGVGAGANILARFALNNPNKVAALCLINCVSTPAGWIEWGYQKLNARHLRSKGMTQGVLEYLMWHHFGRVSPSCFFIRSFIRLILLLEYGRAESRSRTSLQKLLRTQRKPDKPRIIYR